MTQFEPKYLVAVALGGAAGAIGRYVTSFSVNRWLGPSFPWGTLTVNLVGCFLLGLIAHTVHTKTLVSEHIQIGLTIGFLGALTTFSTFGLETFNQLEEGQWKAALANIGASVLLGLLAVWAGISLARFFSGTS